MATIQNLNFNPTSISGCALWLDATDLTSLSLTGTSVTEWRDKSGNNKNFTASTGNPSLINDGGRNVLDFPSGVVMSSSSTITFTSTPFFFIVAKVASISASGTSMLLSVATDYSIRFNSSGLNGTPASPGNTGDLGNSNYYVTGNFNPNYALSVYTSNYNIIGTAVASNGGGTSTFTLSSTFMSRFFVGRISEVILYPTLTIAQRQQVEGYLAWKWGIQSLLPTSHPYYRIAPNSAGLGYPTNIPVSIPTQALVPSMAPLAFFNPTTITGCQLWLDAADSNTFTLSGNNVTTWRDKSGNAANATGSGTAVYTTNVFNQLPAVYFNGSNSYLGGSITNQGTQGSFFSVFQMNTGITQYARLASFGRTGSNDYDSTAFYNVSYDTSTNALSIQRLGAISVTLPSLNRSQLLSVDFNGTNGTIYLNGGTTSNTAASSATFNIGNYRLGAAVNNTGPTQILLGYIGEAISYSNATTTSQRQQVEGYLAWKWGLSTSLPSNHPYRYTVPGLTVNIPIPILNMAPASFSPRNISGLQVWLDGADPYNTGIPPVNGATISTWIDKSGNGRNFTVVTGGPTYNTANYVNFTASNSDYMRCVSTFNVTVNNTTVYYVAQLTGTSGFGDFLSFGGSPSIRYVNGILVGTPSAAGDTNDFALNNYYVNGNFNPSGTTSTYTNVHIVSATNQNVTATQMYLSDNFLSRYFVGRIYEFLVYSSAPSLAQRQTIEGYLAWKWNQVGLLPANNLYKKWPPPPN